MRRFGLVLVALVAVLTAVASTSALASGASGTTGTTGSTAPSGPPGVTPHVVACPAGVAALPAKAEWVWSNYGKPSTSAAKVSYSQSGGNGSWSAGAARGTICSESQGGGEPKRSIVMKVSGPSKLAPGTRRAGLLGIGITLGVSVTRSGDPGGCPVGSTGTVTLFASYYGTHVDKARMSFAGACAAWDESFASPSLHVLISNNGAMIRPG